MLKTVLSDEQIKKAIFITDSEDDRDVLDCVELPYLVEPTGEKTAALKSNRYIPLRYTFSAKFDRRFAVDQIIFVDLTISLLAATLGKVPSTSLIVGLISLFFSLMLVYEIGYFENDQVAAKKENSPRLKSGAIENWAPNFELPAWVWASVLGLLGCLLVTAAQTDANHENIRPQKIFLCWAAVLLAIRGTFYLYNRQQERKRVPLYFVLQTLKSLGVLIVVSPTHLSAVLPLAQAIMMAMKYAVYRYGGEVEKFPKEIIRFTWFAILTSAAFVTSPGSLAQHVSLASLLLPAWCLWRVCRSTLRKAVRNRLGAEKHLRAFDGQRPNTATKRQEDSRLGPA